ncbi:serine protease [Chytridiales sp. JEL 0842]|nr:serine protease [Chytridiales sp. JEL 0842]
MSPPNTMYRLAVISFLLVLSWTATTIGTGIENPKGGDACDASFHVIRCIGTSVGLCYNNAWVVTPCTKGHSCVGGPGYAKCEAPSAFPIQPSGLQPFSGITTVPNQYIVIFKPTVQPTIISSHEIWLNRTAKIGSAFAPPFSRMDGVPYPNIPAFPTFTLLHKYVNPASKFQGYAAQLSPEIAASLKTLPEVASVEQDTVIRVQPLAQINCGEQTTGAPWGLRRLSKETLPLPDKYTYPGAAGAGVDAYIIDTGVDISNPEFEGRAKIGISFSADGNDIDGHGHGSHVAGTVAAKTYGVAKKANIIAVKVLSASGSGFTSDVIAGVNWAAQQAGITKRGSVINMSLGGGKSAALDSAVAAAVKAGVTTVVAAGNENADACNGSPAGAPEAITVGASDIGDTFASFSNWGTCVDVIAPGVSVESIDNQKRSWTISGTSMASPHVAGIVAVGLSTGRITNANEAIDFIQQFGVKDLNNNSNHDYYCYYDNNANHDYYCSNLPHDKFYDHPNDNYYDASYNDNYYAAYHDDHFADNDNFERTYWYLSLQCNSGTSARDLHGTMNTGTSRLAPTATGTSRTTKPAVKATPIPDQYIVVFKSTAEAAIIQNHQAWLNKTAKSGSANSPLVSRIDGFSYPDIAAFPSYSMIRRYSVSSFRGYTARVSAQIAAAIQTLPEVAFIEQDAIVRYVEPALIVNGIVNNTQQTTGAPWGLRRLSKATLPLPSAYTYPLTAGAGVDAYIIDTGVDISNPEFEGRAKIGISFSTDGNDIDGNGHGSHVAGTVAAKTYGVAKKANIIAVKVLSASGSGLTSDVIAGVNWAAQQAGITKRGSVINMSLGGGKSAALDSAVAAAVKAGVTTVVAAGNENADACNGSPAGAPEAITVGASDIGDTFASFSNWGTCVDVIAPGVSIESIDNQKRSWIISGTSMASPHVAGIVAVGLSTGRITNTNEAIDFIQQFGVKDLVNTVKGSVNLLAQIGPISATTTTTTATKSTTTPSPPVYTCGCPSTYQGAPLSVIAATVSSLGPSIRLINGATTPVDAFVSILGGTGSDSYSTLTAGALGNWARVAGVGEWTVFRQRASGSIPERRVGIFVNPATAVKYLGMTTAVGTQEYPNTGGKLIISETTVKNHITVMNEAGLNVTVQMTSYTGGSSDVFNLDGGQTGVWLRTGWEGVVIRERGGSNRVVSIYTYAGTVLTFRRF